MPGSTLIDSRVARRYAKLEPHDRAYPDVLTPCGDFGERQYRELVARTNAELIPAPIQIHVTVPDGSGTGEYCVEQLLREVELVAPLVDHDRDVISLSCSGAADRLAADSLTRLIDSLTRQFHFADSAYCRFGIEPDMMTWDSGRIAACRAAGADEIDVVVTFGLAPQTPDGFASAFQAMVDERPDRVCLDDGVLTRRPGPSLQPLAATARLAMLESAADVLHGAGYVYAGTGRFDLAGSDSVPVDCDRIGLGPGAVSRLGDAVTENAPDPVEWQSALDARRLPVVRGVDPGFDDRVSAEVLRALLSRGEIDIGAIEQRLGIVFEVQFSAALNGLRQLEKEHLVRIGDGLVTATSRGRQLWRILAACFDRDHQLDQQYPHDNGRDVEESSRGESAQ